MKHAYLILAHSQFEILECLIALLDDARNDIYVHIDRKVVSCPVFQTHYARLFILSDRLDVRWGDVSVVEAELLLFSEAYQNDRYGHYHLLSGVDLPLQTQDSIHAFCAVNSDKQFIGFSSGDQCTHIARKVQRWHLFPRYFRSKSSLMDTVRRLIRFTALRLQFLLDIRRNRHIHFKKGTQWVSLTHDFVGYILQQKQDILSTYRYTFCADEIFVQTLCWNSQFRHQIYDAVNEGNGSQRLIRWKDNQLYDWRNDDFQALADSSMLFARKFNQNNMDVVDRLKITLEQLDAANEHDV